MRNIQIVAQKQEIDALFIKIGSFSGDFELQSHWSMYLCVRVSGFLENSVRILYREYARSRGHSKLANFVESRLRGFPNPNMESIIQLAGSFSPMWADSLKSETEGQLKASVDSIVSNRHTIVHGGHAGITLSRVKEYYKNAIKVIELIEEQCS